MRTFLALSLLSITALHADTLSDTERKYAVEQLQLSREKFLAAIQGITSAQWTFRPAEGRWTIGEVAEHLIATEQAIPGLLQQQLLKTPAKTEVDRKLDDRIVPVLRDRSRKAQAPEVLKPSGKVPSAEAAIQAFQSARQRTLGYVESTQDDLRHHTLPHPAFGPIDGYQWLVFLAGHAERHTMQIEEIKAAAGYPK